jgi:transcriptional regulator with GAF, ATPase, and Fis domain
MTVNRALEKASLHHAFYYLRHEQPYLYSLDSIVAESPAMKQVLDQVAHLAPSDSTVLITGETGVGKNLIAGAIHANSARREATIVTVSCAALAESLLESELFGHEKGAFTGAVQPSTGRFQQAHGGTLFLDEVGEISPAIQAKLLRAIEEQLIYRLGGSREIHVNVRIIAATNRELQSDVEQGKFRRDLFYRLNVAPLLIPPMRERVEDILPLTERFSRTICDRMKRPKLAFSQEAQDALLNYHWPGNVRELRNVVERTALFSHEAEVGVGDLMLATAGGDQVQPNAGNGGDGYFVAKTLNLDDLERQAIMAALEESNWLQTKAAKMLGLTPSSLSYKLNRLDVRHPKFRSRRRR